MLHTMYKSRVELVVLIFFSLNFIIQSSLVYKHEAIINFHNILHLWHVLSVEAWWALFRDKKKAKWKQKKSLKTILNKYTSVFNTPREYRHSLNTSCWSGNNMHALMVNNIWSSTERPGLAAHLQLQQSSSNLLILKQSVQYYFLVSEVNKQLTNR